MKLPLKISDSSDPAFNNLLIGVYGILVQKKEFWMAWNMAKEMMEQGSDDYFIALKVAHHFSPV